MDHESWFTDLYRAHYGAVLRYAARRVDPEAARDVAAETFLVVWRRPSAVPVDPTDTEPWLYGVARRVLANRDRSHRRAEHLAARLADGDRLWQSAGLADMVVERERLKQALRGLSERDQEVLRLIAWEELDLGQAAVAMGCSRSAMAVRLHRARQRMIHALRASDRNDGGAMRLPTRIAEETR